MPDVGGAGGLGGCRAIYRLSLPLGISVEGDGLLNLMVSSPPLSPPRTSPSLASVVVGRRSRARFPNDLCHRSEREGGLSISARRGFAHTEVRKNSRRSSAKTELALSLQIRPTSPSPESGRGRGDVQEGGG